MAEASDDDDDFVVVEVSREQLDEVSSEDVLEFKARSLLFLLNHPDPGFPIRDNPEDRDYFGKEVAPVINLLLIKIREIESEEMASVRHRSTDPMPRHFDMNARFSKFSALHYRLLAARDGEAEARKSIGGIDLQAKRFDDAITQRNMERFRDYDPATATVGVPLGRPAQAAAQSSAPGFLS